MDKSEDNEMIYGPITRNLRYYIIYDKAGNEVAEGTYYECVHEMGWTDSQFKNFCRRGKKFQRYEVVELSPQKSEDEITQYYCSLLENKNRPISYPMILEVQKAVTEHHYLEQFSKEETSIGLFTFGITTPEFVAKNLILQTYALISVSTDLSLEEISDYYHLPLWLVEIIDGNFNNIFDD